jgi:phosphoenolpyruvate-protein phosphotransferase
VRELRGTGASTGIGIGPALIFRRHAPAPADSISADAVGRETARLAAAVARAREDLAEATKGMTSAVGREEAGVFEAQALMLDDPELIGRAERLIQDALCPAERAIEEAGADVAAQLESLPDEYLRARAADVRDVAARVRAVLEGATHPLAGIASPSVIVADELLPSDTAALDRRKVLGFVTEVGSPTAHAAILARALGIPAVVGVPAATSAVSPGEKLIVDGVQGVVLVAPDAAAVAAWEEQRRVASERRAGLAALRDLPAETTDGHRIEVAANVGSLEDVAEALRQGAEGVGLFRTEFLFMRRAAAPGEDEQFETYRAAAAAMAPRPVIVRTLDIGGDKPLPWLAIPREDNPFLGLRGLRLCLRHEDVFLTQLRALLRAAAHGHVWIMLPMVSDAGEVRETRRLIRDAQAQLAGRGVSHGPARLGIMIEIPSAAVLADTLFGEVEFFSVGTNDLVQYALAVDRTNPRVATLADALHPAVLRLIAAVTRAPGRGGRWVGVCGELAGDPLAAPLLVGLGVNELSMTPSSLPEVKAAVRAISLGEARALVDRALACGTAAEVRALLAERAAAVRSQHAPRDPRR